VTDILTNIFSTQGLLVGTIIPFLCVLTVVVFVHEMGHYLVGRACGIGVQAFSIGFGPELAGFTDQTVLCDAGKTRAVPAKEANALVTKGATLGICAWAKR